MFRGQYEHTMDGKGRISFPASFRDALEILESGGDSAGRIILTHTFDPCLVLYPLGRWLEFEAKIRQLPQFNPHVQALKRVYIAGAVEASLDATGRLLIPPAMRERAGLERDCVWAGQLDTIELWSRERWNKAMDTAMSQSDELQQAMGQLGL